MRKRLTKDLREVAGDGEQNWIDLENMAQVELTSEDTSYPVEGALGASSGPGWRAAHGGRQTIRLLFDQPQKINKIQLLFHEKEHARTQEFLLSWSSDHGQSYREIVRQQYNFSPPAVTDELEDYKVDLTGVTDLKLIIVPEISGGDLRASLARLSVG